MRVIKYICDECKKRTAIYRVRLKIEKLNKNQKESGKSIDKGIFCKKCSKIFVVEREGEQNG